MQNYTLAPEGFNRVKQRLTWSSVVSVGVIAFALCFSSLWSSNAPRSQDSATLLTSAGVYLVIILLAGVFVFLALSENLRKLQKRWVTYCLTLSATTITKEEAGLPTIVIPIERITGLQESLGEGLTIKTEQKHEFIFIPASLIGYEQVKSELERFREIELKPNSAFSLQLVRFLVLAILAVGLLYAVFSSNKVLFVLPAGVLLILFFGWGLIESQRSPLYSKQQKRMMWGMVLPCIALLAKIISVLL